MTPYEPTREIPAVRPARPSGYVPAPDTSPVRRVLPPVQAAAAPLNDPAPEPDREDYELDILTPRSDYPDPRSRNPLHVYGPAIFVVGAVALLIALLLLLLRVVGVV